MKRICAYGFLAASLVTMSARGEEISQPWYLGVGMGVANISANKSSFPVLTPGASIDSRSYNLSLITGYRFDPLLGVEMGYLGGGSVKANDAGKTTRLFDVSLLSISAVLNQPLNDQVKLYARLGGTFWRFASQQNAVEDKGFGPVAGVGVDINLYGNSERILRMSYDFHKIDGVHVKNVGSLSVNAIFLVPGK